MARVAAAMWGPYQPPPFFWLTAVPISLANLNKLDDDVAMDISVIK